MRIAFLYSFAVGDQTETFLRMLQDLFFLGQKHPNKKLTVRMHETNRYIELSLEDKNVE